jgi:hypothetical protein
MGEPWWDYVIPLFSLARGFALKRLPYAASLSESIGLCDGEPTSRANLGDRLHDAALRMSGRK